MYALLGDDGRAVVWSTHVAFTGAIGIASPCGDITPTVGITGTPVIDEARGEAVRRRRRDWSTAARPIGWSGFSNTATGDGRVEPERRPVGLHPGRDPFLQRTGLTLDAGHVVFGYGGNFGDCSTYHGWVMSVPEAGGAPATFAVDSASGESQGAIWMGGAALVIDAAGNIWVTVAGNGSVTSTSPRLRPQRLGPRALVFAHALEQYFAVDVGLRERQRPRSVDRRGPAARRRPGVGGRQGPSPVYLWTGPSLGGIGGTTGEPS